jgi:hypothetical protein
MMRRQFCALPYRKDDVVDPMPLHLAIAFFGIQVVAWTGLCAYLYATRRRRSEASIAKMLSESKMSKDAVAQA